MRSSPSSMMCSSGWVIIPFTHKEIKTLKSHHVPVSDREYPGFYVLTADSKSPSFHVSPACIRVSTVSSRMIWQLFLKTGMARVETALFCSHGPGQACGDGIQCHMCVPAHWLLPFELCRRSLLFLLLGAHILTLRNFVPECLQVNDMVILAPLSPVTMCWASGKTVTKESISFDKNRPISP